MTHRWNTAAAARTSATVGFYLLALALFLSGCSVEQTLPFPGCTGGGSHLIVAQSVPAASQIPCLEFVPNGWSIDKVSVKQDRSEITLDSDRAGSGAAVLRLVAACDIGDAVSSPSEFAEAKRFDKIERLAPGFRASRFYRFEGGCVEWSFDFDDDASATEAVALGDALRLVSRQVMRDQVRDTFLDEEL